MTFEICTKTVRDPDLAMRLSSVAPMIEAAAAEYEQCGAIGTLFTIQTAKDVGGKVVVDEMRELYKGTLSRAKSPARHIYDAIKAGASGGLCPLCGQREASTLDHYLPQSRHPALTVSPINLVPACSDCNKAKLDSQPVCPEDQTLHPYFDTVDRETWLRARVLESDPVAVTFEVDVPIHWPILTGDRIRRHFATFRLGALYATHASAELLNMRFGLNQIAVRGGTRGLRDHLEEQAISRRQQHANSWQTALYQALYSSPWFCAEGYLLIPGDG
jgi:hypothetical protein